MGPRRSGCRCASRSAVRPGGRSGPPCRSRARAGSRVRRPAPSGLASSTTVTLETRAGLSALPTRVAGSSDQSMMSIFSPCSSFITARTRWPIGPMQEPLAFTPGTLDFTAILVRWPASRAIAADLDGAVGDLGHLEGEQLLDQVRVGAREHHLRAAHALADADHQALDAGAVGVVLVGHALPRRAAAPRACRGRPSRRRGCGPAGSGPRRCRPPCRRTHRTCARPRRRAGAAA